jgi:hypothetical protein
MEKPRFMAGAFFDSVFSLADGVKLFCNGDVVCFHGFDWVWDLTRDFAGVLLGFSL